VDEVADVVIAGGGPVGAALALALCDSGLDVLLLEARENGQRSRDSRPLALSYGSRLILERLGVWDALAPATAIERIHVSQQGGFGRVMLSAAEAGLPALGYVVDYAQLHAGLESAVRRRALNYVTGAKVSAIRDAQATASVEFVADDAEKAVTARLVVAADGGALAGVAAARTVDYHQSALVAKVRSELPHCHTAFERFTGGGPLALLPSGDELALIWTAGHDHAQKLGELSADEFLAQLQQQVGGRLGAFTETGARSLFPLLLRYAASVTQTRTILIGNAAQTLHPVAGQGFNLGLRDAWELAGELMRCTRDAIGNAAMLQAYRARRRIDRSGGIAFTDSLVRLFSNDIMPLRMARGAGLTLLGCMPPAKDFVVRRMTFGARG
jgi:2-octaprenyl-6-methoxyphenol hydroxylase